MYDHDVFVVFTAFDQRNMASSAFRLRHNSQWFRKAEGGVAEEPTIDSQETTPAPGGLSDNTQREEVNENKNENSDSGAVDRLVVTFNQLREKLYEGIQMGTDPKLSHILLGHRGTKGISGRQCNVVVDDELCIWLHDYHSTHGTAVGHGSQNITEVRRKDTWILAYKPGPDAASRFGRTTIHAGTLAMEIEFPSHAAAHPEYIKNLRAFANRCVAAAEVKAKVPTVEGLDLDSEPSTQAATEAPTPGERLIYYKGKRIGKGEFGEVHLVFRARDGLVFAAKTFKPLPSKRKREEEFPAWLTKIRKEFALMRDNPHPNVAQVFELRETPEPTIIMAYYPQGNMDALVLDEAQLMSGFGQILEALGHLHGKGVVHRDLKPANFLVELKPFFKVVITDFGMANVAIDNAWLTTFCGSLKYTAPEVFPGFSNGHGPPADVWSLGVIGIEWIYDFPEPLQAPAQEQGREVVQELWHKWIVAWGRELRGTLKDEDEGEDQLIDILLHMIEFRAKNRWPAKKCLMRGLEAGLFKRRMADGLIVCANHKEKSPEARINTPPPASSSLRASRQQSGSVSDATIILDKLLGGVKSSSSR